MNERKNPAQVLFITDEQGRVTSLQQTAGAVWLRNQFTTISILKAVYSASWSKLRYDHRTVCLSC